MAKTALAFVEMYINMLLRLYISLNERVINRRMNRVTRSLGWMKDCVRCGENAVGRICLCGICGLCRLSSSKIIFMRPFDVMRRKRRQYAGDHVSE